MERNMTTMEFRIMAGHRVQIGDVLAIDEWESDDSYSVWVERVVSREIGTESIVLGVERTILHSSGELLADCEDGWREVPPLDQFYVIRDSDWPYWLTRR